MDQSYESLMSMSDYRPMIISPHMSPQLNETICGCQCGCGCGCAGPGDDENDEWMSDSETANNSAISDGEESSPIGEETQGQTHQGCGNGHASQEVLSPRPSQYQAAVWLLGTVENLQAGEPSDNSYDDLTGGILDEIPSTGGRSDAISSRGNVQMVSPGPGIGAWLHVVRERTWLDDVPRVYIFTPLRLSAECQHARGKAVEHFLIPDEASVPVLMQE